MKDDNDKRLDLIKLPIDFNMASSMRCTSILLTSRWNGWKTVESFPRFIVTPSPSFLSKRFSSKSIILERKLLQGEEVLKIGWKFIYRLWELQRIEKNYAWILETRIRESSNNSSRCFSPRNRRKKGYTGDFGRLVRSLSL